MNNFTSEYSKYNRYSVAMHQMTYERSLPTAFLFWCSGFWAEAIYSEGNLRLNSALPADSYSHNSRTFSCLRTRTVEGHLTLIVILTFSEYILSEIQCNHNSVVNTDDDFGKIFLFLFGR